MYKYFIMFECLKGLCVEKKKKQPENTFQKVSAADDDSDQAVFKENFIQGKYSPFPAEHHR